MKTYYITFERQGVADVAVKVEADSADEAYEIARDTLMNSMYDTYATNEKPDDCMVINEYGEEC